MLSKPMASIQLPGQKLWPHQSCSASGLWQAGLSCLQIVHLLRIHGHRQMLDIVHGNIGQDDSSLLNHLDRSNLLLLQAFHDRAPLVLLSHGRQAEAERSGMLRARHEHEIS